MTRSAFPYAAVLSALALAACATTPTTPPSLPTQPTTPTQAAEPALSRLAPVSFAELPGWERADHAPALTAFRRSCASLMARAPDAAMAGYGGSVSQWLPACRAAASVSDAQARGFFEAYFTPHRIEATGGQARLTGYFEPIVAARRYPEPGFTEPLLSRPTDMVSVDLAAFAETLDSEGLRGGPRRLTGRLEGGTVRPYPRRSEITPAPGQAFAYAHPTDVYKLQVQGSGRLQFPDGTQVRAAFAAQNGYSWRSALGALRDSGAITSASWSAMRTWMDGQSPDAVRQALGADPSYVFFAEEPIGDPAVGARGAANVPLTPMGSLAVDPAFHPYGAVLFVNATYDGAAFARTLVAQDTGGAIRRGPLRGDVFFGVGPEAGAAAERMNATDVTMWTLMPRAANEVPISALPVTPPAG